MRDDCGFRNNWKDGPGDRRMSGQARGIGICRRGNAPGPFEFETGSLMAIRRSAWKGCQFQCPTDAIATIMENGKKNGGGLGD